jgi:hypothetical protein
MKERDFPKALETAGFTGVDVQFVSLTAYAPDNASAPDDLALRQINGKRIGALENVRKALRITPEALTAGEREELTALINRRYDERVRNYRAGEKVWDMETSTVMVCGGVRPT